MEGREESGEQMGDVPDNMDSQQPRLETSEKWHHMWHHIPRGCSEVDEGGKTSVLRKIQGCKKIR